MPCPPGFARRWAGVVVRRVSEYAPRDFGFLRNRWTCALLGVLLLELHHLVVSRETVRRWLHQEEFAWRRPRPVIRPQDPRRASKLRRWRRLLAGLPADEVAVFQDEVDRNTNPKIGSMWVRRGRQASIETPGTNDQRYLAGSVHWRTGALVWTVGGEARPGTCAVGTWTSCGAATGATG